MDEASQYRVTQKLQERGLTVNTVEPVTPPGPSLFRPSARLGWDDLNLFAQELEAITRSGLPLSPALKALAAESPNPRLKALMNDLHHRLERGDTFEEAIAGLEGRVPPILTRLIRAGEAGGNLPAILQLLSGYTDRMVRLRHTLRITMAYPVMSMALALCVSFFLIYYVVPPFGAVFRDFGASLPALTHAMLAFSDMLHTALPAMLVGLAVVVGLVVAGIAAARRSESGRQWIDTLRLRLPGSGRVYYLVAVTRFCRTLHVLLVSRTPLIDALELSAAASGSPALERAVANVVLQVADGETIADSLRNSGFFGYDLCWLVGASEQRGQVEEAFDHVADKYEREITMQENMLGALATPISVVVIGIVVGLVAISLYLPVFTLGDSISGV